ncbi:MAG: serine hydrolase [Bacteroidota bacterium]
MRVLVCALLGAFLLTGCTAETASPPTETPSQIAEATGFSSAGLDSLAAYLEEAGSSALVLRQGDRVVFSWGDVHRPHTVHSIRKALLNSLYGRYVAAGVLDTSATLAKLGINDQPPGLTPTERQARLADLLKSRSGVYLPAAAESAGMEAARPARGRHSPGEAFYYNNWDFNVLGTVLEQATGQSLYTLFHREIAQPIGMQTYAGRFDTLVVTPTDTALAVPDADGFYQLEPERSPYPAYHFRLSAYDLALYGQLYLNGGTWDGQEVVPESWIEASTTAYSTTNPRIDSGYGMLWYVLRANEERATKSFYHTGTGIHMLGVYPGSDLVFVHRVDTEQPTDFTPDRLYRIIDLVFGARSTDA